MIAECQPSLGRMTHFILEYLQLGYREHKPSLAPKEAAQPFLLHVGRPHTDDSAGDVAGSFTPRLHGWKRVGI